MMHRLIIIAAGLSAAGLAVPAAAQGANPLAETYRQLCGTPAAAATASCTELRRTMAAPAPSAAVAAGPARAAPVAVSAGDAFALPATPYDRTFRTPYGRSTSFEVKVPKGRTVEVEVEAPEGSAQLQVCLIDDGFLGGTGYCHAPGAVDKGRAFWRFETVRSGEVKVKVSKTKGPAGATYVVATRESPRGQGAAMLARLERLAGRPHLIRSTSEGIPAEVAIDYMVEMPGRSGALRLRGEDGSLHETKLSLDDASGDLMFATKSAEGIVYPTPAGEISLSVDGGAIAYAINADGTVRRSVDVKQAHIDAAKTYALGGFLRDRTETLRPTNERAIAAMRRDGPKRIELAKAQRMLEWGAYGQMAGRSWLFTVDGVERIGEYAWETPGQVMVQRFWTSNMLGTKPDPTLRLVHDGTTGKISGQYFYANGSTSNVTLARGPFGETIEDWGDGKSIVEMTAPDQMAFTFQSRRAIPAQTRRALNPAQLAAYQERSRQRQVQLAQQQAAQQNSGGGGGGLFGALLGATMGAAMGGNTEQVMGAAIKGVQIVDPGNQIGQTFGSQADAMVSGQGLNANQMFADRMGLGAVTGGGLSSGGGSYPTKPNLALGSCPGFTEGNYRTVALSGGNDVQLKTMCGQAFEFYTMYKRAIAQGYSEADANRTYAAHEGAVANLRGFVGN